MPNGELLEEIQKILDQEKPVPEITERASVRLVLAALVQVYRKMDENNKAVDAKMDENSAKLTALEEDYKNRTEYRKKVEEDTRKIAIAAVAAVIAVVIDIGLHFLLPGF